MTTTRKAATAKSIEPPQYRVSPAADEEEIIAAALAILDRRLKAEPGRVFDSPQVVKDFLRLRQSQREDQYREMLSVLFLDSQHRLIIAEDVSTGTLSQTTVYPREIVRRALHHNAASVVLAHNHPSGVAEPSRADENLTRTLKSTLALIDVQVLDHFIVTAQACRSMAEMGLV